MARSWNDFFYDMNRLMAQHYGNARPQPSRRNYFWLTREGIERAAADERRQRQWHEFFYGKNNARWATMDDIRATYRVHAEEAKRPQPPIWGCDYYSDFRMQFGL